ncbi:hypothetical protein FSP39_002591 [Pinctada imbricata]|uniref:Dolichol-phosphate mannosyltransferase subunit 3 n=1 Tax=Pinctada imbricata TaxID=66713 RepID=A0AA89C4X8_PINIB|nr:hypothetical protein FSP39_002591 [Pinctada imbricata]
MYKYTGAGSSGVSTLTGSLAMVNLCKSIRGPDRPGYLWPDRPGYLWPDASVAASTGVREPWPDCDKVSRSQAHPWVGPVHGNRNWEMDYSKVMARIPKLFQWLIGASLFLSVWLAFVLEYVKTDFSESQKLHLLLIFSIAVIAYRVAIFNNCTEASIELHKQIDEAKADLKRKGYKFDNS